MNELLMLLNAVKTQWGIETVEAIKLKIQQENLIYSQELLNSIRFTQDNSPDGDVEFFMADYGKFQDEGVNGTRSAYSTAYQFSGEPGQIRKMGWALKPWADSKGLNAWAVANSIQQKGIEPKRFFNSVIESRLDQLGLDLEAAYINYLNAQINRQNQ